jgi:hypothetical protein
VQQGDASSIACPSFFFLEEHSVVMLHKREAQLQDITVFRGHGLFWVSAKAVADGVRK